MESAEIIDPAITAVRDKLLNRQGRIHRHTDRMDFIDAIQHAQNQAMDFGGGVAAGFECGKDEV